MDPPVFYKARPSRARPRERLQVDPAQHLGLARTVALRYGADPSAVDDSWQYADALLALTRAAYDFDPARGYRFSTVAFTCMRRQVVNGIRLALNSRRDAERRNVSLATKVESQYGTPVDLATTICDREDEPPYETRERRDQIGGWLGRLDDRSRRMIRAYYLDGQTLQEVGDVEGVTRERVRQILDESLAVLRRAAGVNEKPEKIRRQANRPG